MLLFWLNDELPAWGQKSELIDGFAKSLCTGSAQKQFYFILDVCFNAKNLTYFQACVSLCNITRPYDFAFGYFVF